MLKEIMVDITNISPASNQDVFDAKTDFLEIKERNKFESSRYWRNDDNIKENFKTIELYFKSINLIDIKDPSLQSAKNYNLLLNEAIKRCSRNDPFKPLAIEPLDFDDAIVELAESIENTEEIRELYRLRKPTTGDEKNSGISIDEASKIKNCFTQGRELFLSGKNGSLMVKPLNLFYALTAYTYGIIILNNPIRYRKDMLPGSHGMAYLPNDIMAQFGGDSPRGTFSDLVSSFPAQLVRQGNISFNIDCKNSVMELYKNRCTVSLGALLSMIPEMSEYYQLTTGRPSRCHPLEIVNSNDPRTLAWEFHIGNGERRPSRSGLDKAFEGLSQSERHGKCVVTVTAAQAPEIKATIYTDIRGKLWYIENEFFPIILPEIATHFLISSIFSNIMRYRPDEWGNVLLNHVDSQISLITRHYFSSFQKKFLLLVLRSVSRYHPFSAP